MIKNIPTKAMLVAWLKNGRMRKFNQRRPEGEIDFIRVNLDGAVLIGFNLSDANFTLATLTNMNVAEAILDNANFTLANLDGTDLSMSASMKNCRGVPIGQSKPILENSPECWEHLSSHLII